MKEKTATTKVKSYERTAKLIHKQCPYCKQWFWGPSKKIYDKDACRQRADYEEHKEQRQQERRERYRAAKKPVGKK